MGSPDTPLGPRRLWRLLPAAPSDLAGELGVPPLQAQLLHNRGVTTPDEVEEFLAPRIEHLHDPFLFADMERAVARIVRALRAGETIAVYGDFDTDGVTATVIVYEALAEMGGTVLPYIPHRVREGHGLNADALAWVAAQGASLLLTVDTGVTAVAEVETARARGMETIITDHHAISDSFPSAHAVITPFHPLSRYPHPSLTGAGLAFKLVQAVCHAMERPVSDGSLELAALGTVADMAPMRDENRTLTRLGLEALRRTNRPGLLAIMEETGTVRETLDHDSIPFLLAPRLNAAGRMGSADLSFELLTCASMERAREMARELEGRNRHRQEATADLVALALPHAQAQAESESLLFVSGEEFLPGVNGLVATRLVEALYRPSVVVAAEGGVARGSGRSIPKFNLAHAFSQCRDLFDRFGGHPMAAGFTAPTSHLPAIQRRLQDAAKSALEGTDLVPTQRIDAETTPRALLGETYRFLRSLAPYGPGNPPPAFLTRSMKVTGARTMGATGQHLRLTVKHEGATWDAVAFGMGRDGGWDQDAWRRWSREGPHVDLVYTPSVDRRRGQGTLQLRVLDLRPSGGRAPTDRR